MNTPQPGILQPIPAHARFLAFSLDDSGKVALCLNALREVADGGRTVVGIGSPLTEALKCTLPGLKRFPLLTAPGLSIEHAPDALWLWLRGEDRGDILHRSRHLTRLMEPAFKLELCRDAFEFAGGRDLSDYEDGTENPKDNDALTAGFVAADHPHLAASSYVAVQHWQHDFAHFESLSQVGRDHTFGRRHSDNEEIDDAPESAHVKRTAQESFTPEAFVLRRSMPWAEGNDGGLVFIAFGHSLDAFEALLTRMTGGEDGITDALFTFSQPHNGAYYWCPAMKGGKLDLSPLGM